MIGTMCLMGQNSKARIRIDSLIKTNKKLVNYKSLNYCQRINFIDSLVCTDENIMIEKYFKLAIIDISMEASINPKIDNSDFSKAFFTKKEFFKFSDKSRKKLKCKKGKMAKKDKFHCINKN